VLFDVIVTVQIEPFAHAFNVPFGEERENVRLKARGFRHGASRMPDYTDVAARSGSTLLLWLRDIVVRIQKSYV
jgi:hypothetical protein